MSDRAALISQHSLQNLQPFSSAERREPGLQLKAAIRRFSRHIEFDFLLQGRVAADLAQLKFSDAGPSVVRRDELWKSTCFEIFVAPANGSHYFEVNLSPSGDWNLYAFDSYRAGHREILDGRVRLMGTWTAPQADQRGWSAVVEVVDPIAAPGELTAWLQSPVLVLGATAVLEYQKGEREYWALNHAGSKPDFHLRESFRLTL